MGGILYVCHLAVKSFLLKNLNLGFNSNFMVGVFQPSPCEAGAILCKPSGGCNTFARHYLMLQSLEVPSQLLEQLLIHQAPAAGGHPYPEITLPAGQFLQLRLVTCRLDADFGAP